MSFWSVLGRMVQGKPAFVDSVSSEETETASPSAPDTKNQVEVPAPKSATTISAKVTLDDIKTYRRGSDIEVSAWLVNDSSTEIVVNKIELLQRSVRLDRRLGPGERHEAMLYKGPIPLNDRDYRAHVYFTIVNTDNYFVADYVVEYNRQNDGTYFVEEFHSEAYVRDI